MTDKEQIKAIIKQYADKGERLLEEAYGNGDHASTTGFWEGFKNCAENLLRELEDMQEEPELVDDGDLPKEEPVNNDFEMALAEMIDKAQTSVVEPLVIAAQWKDELIKLAKSEEPVSEELNTVAKEYANNITDKIGYRLQLRRAVCFGANWQKEQMMAKAVDVTIAIPYPNGYGGYTQLVDSQEALPFGDNIKVWVIKED